MDSLSEEYLEGVEVRITPAPILRRVAALVIDYGVIGALSYLLIFGGLLILFTLLGFFGVVLGKTSTGFGLVGIGGLIGFIVLLLCVLLLTHIYFIYLEYKRGQTLGKKIFGLKVVSANGSRLTQRQCVLREVMRYVDLFLLLPGLISVLVTARKQRIGDLVSETLVVWSRNEERAQEFLYIKKEAYDYLLQMLQPRSCPADIQKSFFEYINHSFLSGDYSSTPETLRFWSEKVDEFVDKDKSSGVEVKSKLRFYAEFLLQKSYEGKKETQHG